MFEEGSALLGPPGVLPGCVSVMLGLRGVGGAGFLTGGEIPQQQDGPDLPRAEPASCQSFICFQQTPRSLKDILPFTQITKNQAS